MSHLNLPSRIHEPQKVKWISDEYTFTCIIDDRFTPISAPIKTREPKAELIDTSVDECRIVNPMGVMYVI
jgi:hypothetical protein